jgi:hypothetical protein
MVDTGIAAKKAVRSCGGGPFFIEVLETSEMRNEYAKDNSAA